MSILPRTEHQHNRLCSNCTGFTEISVGPIIEGMTGLCTCPNSDHYGHSVAGFHPGCLSYSEHD